VNILKELLLKRQFLPLFSVQFLGAVNGNLCKNATIVLSVYRLGQNQDAGGAVIATVAAGMFVLPFLLFSASAGQWADHHDKARLIFWSKGLELLACLVAIVGFEGADARLLIFALFLLGSQAAIFGPAKYGILPDHLSREELLPANALVEASTFIAILAGTLIGSLTILGPHGVRIVQILLIVIALAGMIIARLIPPAPAQNNASGLDLRWLSHHLRLFGQGFRDPRIWRAIGGVSWFWLVGATFLAQFPAIAKQSLHADAEIVSLFLGMFSIGVGCGALLCPRLLKGRSPRSIAPYGLLGIAFFGCDFALALHPLAKEGEQIGIAGFLHLSTAFRLLADLALTSFSAGLYVVPLYTRLQSLAPADQRARIIAANNISNALFMTAGALCAAFVLAKGVSVATLLFVVCLLNLPIALAGLTAAMIERQRMQRMPASERSDLGNLSGVGREQEDGYNG
jgi:acyl-[acyl-carrier-protein]-phospholipid O-acyltransferase/long-chain-fatty-acid--[acyl-carrier-protein] ligase